MKKKQTVYSVYVFLCLLAIMVGCNTNMNEEKDAQLALLKTTNPTPTTLVSDSKKVSVVDIKKDIESIDDIYDVAVIRGKSNTLVVYKVKHLQRFHMKGIEKEVNSILENKYPKESFIVSSDYKIFLEAVRLGEKMKDMSYPEKKANQELERIIKLKKEMT